MKLAHESLKAGQLGIQMTLNTGLWQNVFGQVFVEIWQGFVGPVTFIK